jgi:uncharacterized membrane protein
MKTVIAILGTALLALSLSARATVAQYEVRGVASNDKLNVRAAPTHTARILGRIPYNGRGIEIIAKGRGVWVKVSYGRLQGFVNRQFLALSKPRLAAAKRPLPPAEPAGPTEPSEPDTQPSAVSVDPKVLEAPAPAPAPAPAVDMPTMTEVAAPASPTKLAQPAKPETSLPGTRSENEESPALIKPPADMTPENVRATPSRLSCSGIEPIWTLKLAENAGDLDISEGDKKRLEFSALAGVAGDSKSWTASGRAIASKLSLLVAETRACKMGVSAQIYAYDITLKLDDGRMLYGCCQAAVE